MTTIWYKAYNLFVVPYETVEKYQRIFITEQLLNLWKEECKEDFLRERTEIMTRVERAFVRSLGIDYLE